MKYAVSLFAGLLVGVALFIVGLYLNPFSGRATVSPLAVSDERVMDLSFSLVPGDSILYTDHGESIVKPHPDRVAELWEKGVVETKLYVTPLSSSRGGLVGLGIKFFSKSEQTELIKGKAIANSDWHVYLPGQGTFFIEQTENFWPYIREVIVPARASSGDNWVGTFHSTTTNGPGALGTGRVTGGSGIFEGMDSESVEALTARGYSAVTGPVSMDGNLTIEMRSRAEPAE
jgi:hypothetical protein